jgi:hypothetical protein
MELEDTRIRFSDMLGGMRKWLSARGLSTELETSQADCAFCCKNLTRVLGQMLRRNPVRAENHRWTQINTDSEGLASASFRSELEWGEGRDYGTTDHRLATRHQDKEWRYDRPP